MTECDFTLGLAILLLIATSVCYYTSKENVELSGRLATNTNSKSESDADQREIRWLRSTVDELSRVRRHEDLRLSNNFSPSDVAKMKTRLFEAHYVGGPNPVRVVEEAALFWCRITGNSHMKANRTLAALDALIMEYAERMFSGTGGRLYLDTQVHRFQELLLSECWKEAGTQTISSSSDHGVQTDSLGVDDGMQTGPNARLIDVGIQTQPITPPKDWKTVIRKRKTDRLNETHWWQHARNWDVTTPLPTLVTEQGNPPSVDRIRQSALHPSQCVQTDAMTLKDLIDFSRRFGLKAPRVNVAAQTDKDRVMIQASPTTGPYFTSGEAEVSEITVMLHQARIRASERLFYALVRGPSESPYDLWQRWRSWGIDETQYDALHKDMKAEIHRYTRLISRWEQEYTELLKDKKAAVSRQVDVYRQVQEQLTIAKHRRGIAETAEVGVGTEACFV